MNLRSIGAALLALGSFAVPPPKPADASPAGECERAASLEARRVDLKAPLALPLGNPKIVVIKSSRVLRLYSNGSAVRSYRVGLGLSPVEDKIRAGDRRTPEGDFYIGLKNSRSQFYLSLGLSYPNRGHAERGLREGLISRPQFNQIVNALDRRRMPPQNTRLGGDIFIHGNGSTTDWTWGCVALDDNDVRELFHAVPVGTPVTIQH